MNRACIENLAIAVLQCGEPSEKTAAAFALKALWDAGDLSVSGGGIPTISDHPARPKHPVLVPPGQVKRRRLGSAHGRIALLHAIAHIEFNAIDLAADMLARFASSPRIDDTQREHFIDDWVTVCADEARHFNLLQARLVEMGTQYGDLDAHNGLWEAAIATKDDLAARLAIAPMVLEARGLDVTPSMIEKLVSTGDPKSAAILKIIYTDEIAHVRAGTRWFTHICTREQRDKKMYFHNLINDFFKGSLKPPFNVPARTAANFPYDWYNSAVNLN